MTPDLPEVPLPWLPATPVEVAQPAPASSLWEARSSQAAPKTRPVPPRHGGRRALVSVLVLGALGAGGYLAYTRLSGSDASEPTIQGADPALSTPVTDVATTAPVADTVLPDIANVRPPYRTAKFVQTSRQIGEDAGVAFEETIEITAETDYVTPVASFTFDIRGSLSSLNSQVILTNEHSYIEGDTPDAPWKKSPREISGTGLESLGYLKMYGEVVTPAVREAATDVVATNDVVNGVPVTTYRFDVPWTTLTGTADLTSTGIADAMLNDELRVVHMTLSVDTDGLLRVYEEQYEEQAWNDAAAAAPADLDWYVRYRVVVFSTSNEPSTVVPPALFVDGPTG